jgi:hypothetical protein
VIASRLGLIVLTIIAIGLGGVLAAGSPTTPAVVDVRPWTSITVDRLRWERRQSPPVEIVRDGDGWKMVSPAAGPVDAAVAGDVVGTLQAARWQRRDNATRVPPNSERLAIVAGERRLRIGPDVGGGAWIADGDVAYLVESWVIQALDRSALDLRAAAPLAVPATRITGVEIHAPGVDLVAADRPLALATPAGKLVIATSITDELFAALAAIRVVAIGPAPAARTGSIRLVGSSVPGEIELRGPCPHLAGATAVTGTAGDACVDTAALDRALDIGGRIAGDPLAAAEPRPVTSQITAIQITADLRLQWNGATPVLVRADGATFAADDDRAATLRDRFTTPTSIVPNAGAKAIHAIHIDTAEGGIDFEITADNRLVRAGYAVTHRIVGDLAPSFHDLRSLALWQSDAALIESITITDGKTSRTLLPSDAAYGALAAPRVERWLPDQKLATRRTITIRFAPPPVTNAEPEIHQIDLAADCRAIIDRIGVARLTRDLCRLLST